MDISNSPGPDESEGIEPLDQGQPPGNGPGRVWRWAGVASVEGGRRLGHSGCTSSPLCSEGGVRGGGGGGGSNKCRLALELAISRMHSVAIIGHTYMHLSKRPMINSMYALLYYPAELSLSAVFHSYSGVWKRRLATW